MFLDDSTDLLTICSTEAPVLQAARVTERITVAISNRYFFSDFVMCLSLMLMKIDYFNIKKSIFINLFL